MRYFYDGWILWKSTRHGGSHLWWLQHVNAFDIRPSEDNEFVNLVFHGNRSVRGTILRSERTN
jgi:hypothetical protein